MSEVANGIGCNCVCLCCGAKLVAKNKGEERIAHFAHEGMTPGSGEHCAEGVIHKVAKEIIMAEKRLKLPSGDLLTGSALGQEEVTFKGVTLEYRLQVGTTQEEIVVDCFGSDSPLGNMIIEVVVHHGVNEEKRRRIEALGIPAMQIDLSDSIHQAWTYQRLREEVLNCIARREWIHPPATKAPCAVPDDPARPRLLDPFDQKFDRWLFRLKCGTVTVTQLTRGPLHVHYEQNPAIRAIIQPICEQLYRSQWFENAHLIRPNERGYFLRVLYDEAISVEIQSLRAEVVEVIPGGICVADLEN